MIIKMLRSCREQETRYIVRALCRNMRIGANTTLVLSALAHAVVKHRRDGDGDPTKSPVKKAGKGAQTKKKPVVSVLQE